MCNIFPVSIWVVSWNETERRGSVRFLIWPMSVRGAKFDHRTVVEMIDFTHYHKYATSVRLRCRSKRSGCSVAAVRGAVIQARCRCLRNQVQVYIYLCIRMHRCLCHPRYPTLSRWVWILIMVIILLLQFVDVL